MIEKIRVGILDDHQSTVDGYRYRLNNLPNLEVVATVSYGQDLEPMLETDQIDLLLLDVSVPTSPENSNPYPILYAIPRILTNYPELAILVISMHNQRTLIRSVMEAGASGYILKDDRDSILKLGEIISAVINGGIYFSEQSYQLLNHITSDGKPNITARQGEVLSLMASNPNATTGDLARILDIAPSTVRNLLSDAYIRLNVRNKTAAIVKARKLGLITPFSANPED